MKLQTITHQADLCVIGGGLSGLSAAVSAARRGAKVVLMQERPMLGGNASSEIRMWVCGAHGRHNQETGLVEELFLENFYRNPDRNYSIWDSVMYGMVRAEENITLLLNCSCMDAEMAERKIASVTGWQMTTQQFHRVEAKLFADCSGDSILAPLTGAPCLWGREARSEHGESFGPEVADKHTMGMSCLLQAVETDEEYPFIAPEWAEKVTKENRHPGNMNHAAENFWYLELGGMQDTIHDTEKLRDELVPLAYGMWDYLKNDPEQAEKHRNWRLDWVGMLPGKRESRRYVGAYTMTANDVEANRVYPDEIAYGGWPMDDHDPAGYRGTGAPNINHPAPTPYGIPFGVLYSEAVPNLMFAGRNISVTHAAMSSTRVMATCALLGQAVGTAAAIATTRDILPGEVAARHMAELQAMLMDDDCFLPHLARPISDICRSATLTGGGEHIERLRDGIDRDRPDAQHAWEGKIGDTVTYTFAEPCDIHRLRLVTDSDLNRDTHPKILHRNMYHNRPKITQTLVGMPTTVLKAFRITATFADGTSRIIAEECANHQRLWKQNVALAGCTSITLEPLETWGSEAVRLFAFEAM